MSDLPLPRPPRLPPLPAAHPRRRLSVTVPAKDEAGYITQTLQALARQQDGIGQPLDPTLYEVIVLANNCRDATAEVARAFGRQHPRLRLHVAEITLPPAVAGVGLSRKLMMDAAARRLPSHGIIATTDADTRVGARWVAYSLRAFDRGARAVGGRILVPRGERRGYRKIHLQDVTYRSLRALLETMIDPSPTDPWPRHFQHYGPSLAVRADAYLACGGMPPVKSIEDAAFAWALERTDVEIVHDPSVRVYTSDRGSDRIGGVTFSGALDAWTEMDHDGRVPVVFGLEHCIELYKWKVALQQAFHRRRVSGLPALPGLCDRLNISLEDLSREVREAPTAGDLYVRIRQQLERLPHSSDAPFPEAIRDLRRFTGAARDHRASGIPPDGSVPGGLAAPGRTP